MSAITKGTIVAAMLAGFAAFGIERAVADEAQYIIKPLHGITVHVGFDTGEGKELAFYCGPSATAMAVQAMQQTAYTPAVAR